MEIRCPVSCKFPHGTLHYQSRTVFSSLVGGSTFFNPHIMYEFTRIQVSPSCTGGVELSFHFFPESLPFFFQFGSSLLIFEFSFRNPQFRSPLLSGSLLISSFGTKMFQFPSFSSLFDVCFCMYGIQSFHRNCSSLRFHFPWIGLSQCLTPFFPLRVLLLP